MAASILGILVFSCGVPFVTAVLISQPRLYRLCLSLLAFTTCHVKKPFYQEVFFETYRGVDRGFGVTIPDLFFFGFFLFILMGGTRRKIVWKPHNTLCWIAICAISFASLVSSPAGYYGLFTFHKMIRCLVLYWVMVNAIRDEEDVRAVIKGLVAAVIFQGWMVVFDRYVTKKNVNRSVGSFPHPNTLAMYLDLILPMILSLELSKCFSRRQSRWAMLAIALGAVCVILTKSRAALVIMLGSLAGVMFASVLWKPTLAKFKLIGIAAFFAMIGGAMVAPMIIKRFTEAPEASHQTRVYFNEAAEAMANDKPLGVGLNAYSWALANTEYYWMVYPDKVDTVKDPVAFRDSKQGMSRLGTAHHIYWLYAAEIGYLGMWLFVVFIARFYLRNIWCFLSIKDVFHRSIFLGLLSGFGTLHLQGLLEWIFRQTQVMYLFFLLSGLMIACQRIAKERKKEAARARASARRAARLQAAAVA